MQPGKLSRLAHSALAPSGRIRMLNGDVKDPYRHVQVGATVIVL